MNVLLTGYTGSLGPELARALAPHRVRALVREASTAPQVPGVELIEGTLEALPAGLEGSDIIVHGAASTAFRATPEELRRANVEGTARVLELAARCPHLRRFVHLSTMCVSGCTEGVIAEAPLPTRPRFVNAYEETKWEAEQLVLASGLPAEIARISFVAGSERDGAVRRPGALHHTLYWLYKGLIPMLPGRPEARVDLVSTEFVAASVAALVRAPIAPGRIVHLAAGDAAPTMRELLDHLCALFARTHRGWARGCVAPPAIVDGKTFALFQDSVERSGDALFQRICSYAQLFLPALLHPRVAATSPVRDPQPRDWHPLVERALGWLIAHDWGRAELPSSHGL